MSRCKIEVEETHWKSLKLFLLIQKESKKINIARERLCEGFMKMTGAAIREWWRRCRMWRCNANTFAHRPLTQKRFYIRTLLYTDAFTHRFFSHTHTVTHSFTHIRIYTHTHTFTHWRVDAQTRLHANIFTHGHDYAQNLNTQIRLHTPVPLHTDNHTHRNLHAQTFTTHSRGYTQNNLNRPESVEWPPRGLALRRGQL